jgi:hypothetical protein
VTSPTNDATYWKQEVPRELRSAIVVGISLQVLLFVLGELFLDHGATSHAVLRIGIAYWVGVAIIVIRRPRNLTRLDVLYIRWGNPLLVLAAVPVAWYYWHYRGIM